MRQRDTDTLGESDRHFLVLSATTLLFHRLVAQKVTTIRAATHDLARTGHFEAFANRLVGLTHRKGENLSHPSPSVNYNLYQIIGPIRPKAPWDKGEFIALT